MSAGVLCPQNMTGAVAGAGASMSLEDMNWWRWNSCFGPCPEANPCPLPALFTIQEWKMSKWGTEVMENVPFEKNTGVSARKKEL